MMLAQFGKDEAYVERHRELVKSGATVILDNGAYEDEMLRPVALHHVFNEVDPTYMVIPDFIGRQRESEYLLHTYLDFGSYDKKRLLAVLHGEDVVDCLRYYHRLRREAPGLGGVCFPKCLRGLRNEVVCALHTLNLFNPEWYHHYLGFWDPSLNEIRDLNSRADEIDSIDSKASFRFATGVDGKLFTPTFPVSPTAVLSHIREVDKACQP